MTNKVKTEIDPNFEQSKEQTYKQSEERNEKMYRVIFKQNRTFELHINNKVYRFMPFESRVFPESIVGTKDFKAQECYFTVLEIV
jgi:hypothetical protein